MSGKTLVNFQVDSSFIKKAKRVAKAKNQTLSYMIREGLRIQMEDYESVQSLLKSRNEQKAKLLEELLKDIREEMLV